MKKFIQWLAKIFKAEITVEKIVYKDKIVEVEVEKLISLDGEIDGDVTVKGDLLVTGSLNVTGGVTCLKVVETNKNK
jgi:cytoskeletal protein CcmA (bactofilin family)